MSSGPEQLASTLLARIDEATSRSRNDRGSVLVLLTVEQGLGCVGDVDVHRALKALRHNTLVDGEGGCVGYTTSHHLAGEGRAVEAGKGRGIKSDSGSGGERTSIGDLESRKSYEQ